MIAERFFGLQSSGDGQWEFVVEQRHCSPVGGLFGGVALAAAIEALERETGWPLVWATAQFVGVAPADARVSLQSRLLTEGRTLVQGEVSALAGGEVIMRTVAALGARDSAPHLEGRWVTMPAVPGPHEAPERPPPSPGEAGTIAGAVDVRLARVRPPEERGTRSADGRSALWFSTPAGLGAAAALGVLGDFLNTGVRQALGARTTSRSLDNTLRMVSAEITDWTLADIHILSASRGFSHGTAFLWSEQGALLGIASQSATIKEHTPR